MKAYLQLLGKCFEDGARQKNRTGIDTFMIPGGMMQFNLEKGFPILTTKRVAFGQVKGELIGFIRGYTNAADFRALGCKIWDANANENKQWLGNPNRKGWDDLGRIYGAQWRQWRGVDNAPGYGNQDTLTIDQLSRAVGTIMHDATSRRIIVSAWQPAELDQMALPPCHLLYQFLVAQEENKLNMCMYMRSCDMFLGVPFNISSYALLLSLVAKATGYFPGTLTMFLADVHIYENHLEQVKQQLNRTTMERPKLLLSDIPTVERLGMEYLTKVHPDDIQLEGYSSHPPIKGDMAV